MLKITSTAKTGLYHIYQPVFENAPSMFSIGGLRLALLKYELVDALPEVVWLREMEAGEDKNPYDIGTSKTQSFEGVVFQRNK